MGGSIGILLDGDEVIAEVLSSASPKEGENVDRLSPADFVGEAKRLSGSMCPKLLSRQMKFDNENEAKAKQKLKEKKIKI